MRSLVVYESWFGNTRRIAEEIADALAHEGEVDLVHVDEPLPPLEDVDLIVVGVGQDARERGDEPHGMIGACTTTRMVTRTEAARTLAASGLRSH